MDLSKTTREKVLEPEALEWEVAATHLPQKLLEAKALVPNVLQASLGKSRNNVANC